MSNPKTNQPTQLSQFTRMTKDALYLAGLIVSLSSVAATVAMSFAWPAFIERLRSDLNVATKDDISTLQVQLDRISGNDKILVMPMGHSFVNEPVFLGEPIDLTLVAYRTERGSLCNFVEATPLFIDGRGIPLPGQMLEPIKQLGQQSERLSLKLHPPGAMQAGRVGVYLSMKYSCPYGSNESFIDIFEETRTLFFYVDEPEGEDSGSD